MSQNPSLASQSLSQARFALGTICYAWSTPAYSPDCCRIKQAEEQEHGMVRMLRRRRWAWLGLFRRAARRWRHFLRGLSI